MRRILACIGVLLLGLLAPGLARAACTTPTRPINVPGNIGSPFTTSSVTRMDTQTSDNVNITGGCIDVPNLYVNGTQIFRPVVTTGSAAAASANSTAINAAIQQMGTLKGGIVYLPCGDIYTGASIDNDVSNVLVVGCGGPNNLAPLYGTGALSVPATNIIPTFAGEVLRHRTPYNASSKINTGGGFMYLTVSDNSIATTLLDIDSIAQGTYQVTFSVSGSSATQAVLSQSCVSLVDINDACDVRTGDQNFTFIIGTGSTTDGYVATGSSNANTSFNNIKLTYRNNGTGYPAKFISADNNTITLHEVADAGQPTTFFGPTASHPVGGDQNTLLYVTGAVGIVAQGTDTPGVTSGVQNTILRLDTANSTPVPTAGTGAAWNYVTNTSPLRNAATQFLGAQGSATTPGLSFQGDTNTGFYDSGSQINIALGGVFSGSVSTGSLGTTGTARPYVLQGTTTSACAAGSAVQYRANAKNGAGTSKLYGNIDFQTTTCTNGAEDGTVGIGVVAGGTFSGNIFTVAKAVVTSTVPARLSTGYTVATLPAAPGAGSRAYVTDQLTACVGAGATLTGGGAVTCPVFYNGAAWVGD